MRDEPSLRRLKIQLVSHEPVGLEKGLNHGGVGVSQFTVARGLARLGHEVELLGPAHESLDESVDGVRIRGWRPSRLRFVSVFKNSRTLFKEVRRFSESGPAGRGFTIIPDVMGVSWPYPLPTVKVIKFTCTHLLQAFEANLKRPRLFTGLAERWRVPRADAFFSISERTAEVSGRVLGLDWYSIPVIPNAVDTDLFRPLEDEARDPRLLLYVGTICEKKGALELVEALDILVRRYPDLRLIMIGRNGVDLKKRPDFMGRIRREFPATVERHVEFRGHVPNSELVRYYNRAAVVVLPSRYESFGRTTIEAMACGAVVVRTNAPPAREIIRDGVDGLICGTRDSESIAVTVEKALSDPAAMEEIRRSARKRVLENYAIDVVAKATEAFLIGLQQRGLDSRQEVPR